MTDRVRDGRQLMNNHAEYWHARNNTTLMPDDIVDLVFGRPLRKVPLTFHRDCFAFSWPISRFDIEYPDPRTWLAPLASPEQRTGEDV